MRTKLPLFLLVVSTVVFLASVFAWAPLLPERLATHFDGSGRPNGWMTRSQHVVFITLLGLGIPALVVGSCSIVRFLPSSLLNVPNASYWRSAEHYPKACRIIFHWSLWFGSWSLLWTTLLNYQLVQANRISPPHLETAPFLILVGVYLAGLGILVLALVLSFSTKKEE